MAPVNLPKRSATGEANFQESLEAHWLKQDELLKGLKGQRIGTFKPRMIDNTKLDDAYAIWSAQLMPQLPPPPPHTHTPAMQRCRWKKVGLQRRHPARKPNMLFVQ